MRIKFLASVVAVGLAASGVTLAQTEPGEATQDGSMVVPGSGPLAGATAEEVIGRDVVDINGASVGEVDDLLMGTDGQITHVMVDAGGFLGLGSRTVALELAALTAQEGEDGDLVTSLTREQVEELPAYEERDGQWLPAD